MDYYALSVVVFIVSVGVGLLVKYDNRTKTEQTELYKMGYETHDLNTWRKRGMETVKSKDAKSQLKYANNEDLIGLLYIFNGWDLIKCK